MGRYNFKPCVNIERSKICKFLKDRERFRYIERLYTDEEMFEYNHPEFELAQAIIYDFGEETAERIAKTLLASSEGWDKQN